MYYIPVKFKKTFCQKVKFILQHSLHNHNEVHERTGCLTRWRSTGHTMDGCAKATDKLTVTPALVEKALNQNTASD